MSCIYGIEQSCSECRMCQSKEEQSSTETNKKAILVIDMPKSCEECTMLNGADECIWQDEDANWDADTWDDLMAGCPLKKLPQKKPYKAMEERFTFNKGYNACIDEIVKEAGVNE